MKDFTFYMEIDDPEYGGLDRKDDFSDVYVALPDGRKYKIMVHTYKFLKTRKKIEFQDDANLDGTYLLPPDLFVKKLTHKHIKATLNDLLKKGDLETILHRRVVNYLD